ncbi:hypothetical protein [Halotia branconii]|uniref:Uncharacterized protein n=1 Tax=Halotia branconii CENA392 TaxID=1539056 RepID=A0AAJ6NYP7_9CYAN|nr:hypothetical protein [Halotia branconii]WGV29188.1 hypothetical protein QI031_30775 [Halotia branconii CENA392]
MFVAHYGKCWKQLGFHERQSEYLADMEVIPKVCQHLISSLCRKRIEQAIVLLAGRRSLSIFTLLC